MVLLRDLLRRCAYSYADKVAYIDGDKRRTWSQMHERSDRFACALQAMGVGKGDMVAILAHDHVEVVEHFFGCMKIGAVRVGINWRYAPREMLHLIRDCDAKIILIQSNCLPLIVDSLDDLRGEGRTLIGFGDPHGLDLDYEELIERNPGKPELPELFPDDRITISYTSGTTGLPKGAIWTQKGMYSAMVHTVVELGWRHEDIFISIGSMAGVGIVLNSFPLVAGMTYVLPGGDFGTVKWLEQVQEHRATCSILVPTMLQRVLADYHRGNYDVSSLRYLLYGSEPSRPRIVREAIDVFGCEIMQIYGLTECTGGWLTYLRHADHLYALEREPELLTSVGKPALHMDVSIRSEDGTVMPPGEVGEVWAKGDPNIVGYLNLPEANKELFHDGWLRTNDLGKYDERGYVYLTDRKSFMIITGAFNVYPVVVETVLAEHPAVREVAVVGVPHPDWGEAVIAVVSLRPNTSATEQELIDFCRGKVAKWEVPKFIDFIDELPVGGTNKIAKHSIRLGYRENPQRLPWGDQLLD